MTDDLTILEARAAMLRKQASLGRLAALGAAGMGGGLLLGRSFPPAAASEPMERPVEPPAEQPVMPPPRTARERLKASLVGRLGRSAGRLVGGFHSQYNQPGV